MKGSELQRCLEEALAIVRTLGESALTAEVLSFLSSCAFHDLDLERSAECAEEAVSIARIVGDQGLLGRALVRKATAVSVDDLLGACAVSREAITALRAAGDRGREAAALANLATFERYAGELELAALHYSEALRLVEHLGNTPVVMRRSRTYLLLGLALCLSKMSAEQEEAAILCGAADAQNEQLGLPWETWISDGSEETQAALRQSMQGEAFEIAYAYGRGLALDDAVTLALTVAGKIPFPPLDMLAR